MKPFEIIIPKQLKDGETESIEAVIIDAESDVFKCEFVGDYEIRIDTEKMGYITLDVHQLDRIINMIHEAERIYQKNTKL